ncbi:MAG: FG-GAP repeat protein, partial [Candidatus Saccharibacteria bacterium]|nr:FG-GAP repeat protein [Candidatus Saccharibacteria bacterium]
MIGSNFRRVIVVLVVLFAAAFLYWFLSGKSAPNYINTDLAQFDELGLRIESDFNQYPLLTLNDDFVITDTLKDGIEITYGGAGDASDPTSLSGRSGPLGQDSPLDQSESEASFTSPDLQETLSLQFPKTLQEPIAVTLSGGRTVLVQQEESADASVSLLTSASPAEVPQGEGMTWASAPERPLSEEASAGEQSAQYLKYTTPDARINTYYAYQKDQANGYRNLKHWTVFADGDGEESQSYRFSNAHLRLTDSGSVEVRYVAPPDESVKAQVGDDLWSRAQAVLAKDMDESVGNTEPDFIIPAPYTIDANGNQVTHEWQITKTSTLDPLDSTGDMVLSVSFTVPILGYPIALDPTLQFTAPGYTGAADVITGETTNTNLGYSFATGDFNDDGKDDLAIGAHTYSSNTGRVYIFYAGDAFVDTAAEADVILTGEVSTNSFGWSMTTGDLNADGKDDLAVGAYEYSGNTGRAYVFYGGSIITENASGADVVLTGGAGSDRFADSLAVGDFNADGKDDLAVGAEFYTSGTGRAYIFYGGAMVSEGAAGADVIFTGESPSHHFGTSMSVGDFNGDGKADLVVGAHTYTSNTGRAYIFYGGSMTSKAASAADVILTGETTANYFGWSTTAGDYNGDGVDDVAVAAWGYSSNTGRAYVFYGGSMVSEAASGADAIFTGQATGNYFGDTLATGDFNADGKDDLVVEAHGYVTNTGRVYTFYGGSMTSKNAASADVIMTGESTGDLFGYGLGVGDLNADGKDDLLVGAIGYSTYTGRAYIFYSQSGQVNLGTHITGATAGDKFGTSLATGDFNADGLEDLVVGAPEYSSNTGRAYIFYGYATTSSATGADVTLTGGASNNGFGNSLATGDFNADGKDDLAVGASSYSSGTGRAYIFYGGSMVSENASGADVTFTGEASSLFGTLLTTGDFNADGKDDLAVGA